MTPPELPDYQRQMIDAMYDFFAKFGMRVPDMSVSRRPIPTITFKPLHDIHEGGYVHGLPEQAASRLHRTKITGTKVYTVSIDEVDEKVRKRVQAQLATEMEKMVERSFWRDAQRPVKDTTALGSPVFAGVVNITS